MLIRIGTLLSIYYLQELPLDPEDEEPPTTDAAAAAPATEIRC